MASKQIKFDNPELLLNEFTHRLLRLRAVSSAIQGQHRFDSDLQNVIRKFRISSILADRYTICIAGSQGAGKTTFLRSLYGLGSDWLVDNTGRGEKVPVLIVEDGSITEPQGEVQVLVRTSGTCSFETRQLSSIEFQQVLKGWEPEHVLPVLRVPMRFFNGANLSFLLLPGYEIATEASLYWQDLMRHALLASAACIVVTDRSLLAEASQLDILKDMQEKYLAGSRPVIAITKTEGSSYEERNHLARTAARVFAFNEDHLNRVVCVGTGSEDYIESWRKQMVIAIEAYCTPSTEIRRRRLTYLDELLTKQVSEVLAQIQLEFSSVSASMTAAEREKNEILEEFDNRVTILRKKYRTKLSEKLESHASKACEAGKDSYVDEEEGFWNNVRAAGRWLVTSSGEREGIYLGRINKVWDEAYGSQGFSKSYSELLHDLTWEELHISGGSKATLEAPRNRLGYGANQIIDEPSTALTPAVQANIESLFNASREDNHPLESNDRKEMRKALRLLPVLALEFVRINQMFLSDVIAKVPDGVPKAPELAKLLSNLNDSVNDLSNIHSSIIKAIATILAVDVAADGKIDTIPALFDAIRNVLSASTSTAIGAGAAGAAGAEAGTVVATGSTAAASAAIAAAGTVAVAFIAYSFINQVQQQDAAHRHFITVAINTIRDQHLTKYSEFYDSLMLRIRETLESRLMTRYRLDEGAGRRDAIVRTLADVDTFRADLLEAIRADHSLG